MDDRSHDSQPHDPNEAHRKGLEEIAQPHHPTTDRTKGEHAPGPRVTEPPGEQHRGGPLPNQKR